MNQIDNLFGNTQKPLNPENMKKSKKYKIPHPRLVPPPPKKEAKNTKMFQKLPFLYFFAIVVFFGASRDGGFCIFFAIFSYLRDSGVFGLCTTLQDRKTMVFYVFLDFSESWGVICSSTHVSADKPTPLVGPDDREPTL